jgi:hypothetical protein
MGTFRKLPAALASGCIGLALAGLVVGAVTVNASPGNAIEAATALAAAEKGDLGAVSSCFGQHWPNISSDCLVRTDGGASRTVRTVTFGYETGQATTVLVRMPAPVVASR